MNMPREIKVGDEFTLGDWIWTVTQICPYFFTAMCRESVLLEDSSKFFRQLHLTPSDVPSRNWLTPEVKKLTKEQAEMIKTQIPHDGEGPCCEFADWLDSFTE